MNTYGVKKDNIHLNLIFNLKQTSDAALQICQWISEIVSYRC
jgi:hypothetical protein